MAAAVVRPERIATDDAASPAPRRRRRRRSNGHRAFLIFQIPALVLFGLFVLYPVVNSFYVSLHTWNGVGPMKWVGLQNFRGFLRTSDFAQSTLHSLMISLLVTIVTGVIGVTVAGAIHFKMPGRGVIRTICFLPVMMPVAATATFWAAAFSPSGGIVNSILGGVGLGRDHAFIGSPGSALYVIVFVAVWAQSGFVMIFVLAALENIPSEIYEAARIDGASQVRTFVSVSVPMSRRVITLVAMLELIASFRLFSVVWTMTQGGPGTSTEIFPTVIYKEAFLYDHFGYGAAIAVLNTVIVLALIAVIALIFRPFRAE